MKASWWKYVLLALLTAGVVACGKDNKASNANNNNVNTNPIYSGVGTAPSSNSFAEFKQQVINGQFVQMQNDFERYFYYNVDYQANNNDCDKWLGFITVCSSSSGSSSSAGQFSRYFSKYNNTGSHELGSEPSQVHSQLVSIVNGAVNAQKYGQSSYLIYHADGSAYIIDLGAPVMANPMYYRPADINNNDGYSYWYYRNY